MSADIDTLKRTILDAVRHGPLADALVDADVEFAHDEDGDDFLRVQLSMHLPDDVPDDQLVDLIERIEESVAAVDDRYPSVRFLDAA